MGVAVSMAAVTKVSIVSVADEEGKEPTFWKVSLVIVDTPTDDLLTWAVSFTFDRVGVERSSICKASIAATSLLTGSLVPIVSVTDEEGKEPAFWKVLLVVVDTPTDLLTWAVSFIDRVGVRESSICKASIAVMSLLTGREGGCLVTGLGVKFPGISIPSRREVVPCFAPEIGDLEREGVKEADYETLMIGVKLLAYHGPSP